MIHGQAIDFEKDLSKEKILAHTAGPLDEAEKVIGSERFFGAIDVLIKSNQNYLRRHATALVQSYFPTVSAEHLLALLNAPIITLNPGTIIQNQGGTPAHIYLILAGTVEFISPGRHIRNRLSHGCFIGDMEHLKHRVSKGTWRATSYVRALRFSPGLYKTFLEKHGLLREMETLAQAIVFLRNTDLFGENISYPVQNSIARQMRTIHLKPSDAPEKSNAPCLYLVKKGELALKNQDGNGIDTLLPGDYFGEEAYFRKGRAHFTAEAARDSELYCITGVPVLDIPIVHWKLIEKMEKRMKLPPCTRTGSTHIDSGDT